MQIAKMTDHGHHFASDHNTGSLRMVSKAEVEALEKEHEVAASNERRALKRWINSAFAERAAEDARENGAPAVDSALRRFTKAAMLDLVAARAAVAEVETRIMLMLGW